MRIDRSRIRVVTKHTDIHDEFAGLGLVYGVHAFNAWPISGRSGFMLHAWADGRLDRGSDDEAEVLGWLEDQFLIEELPKLSAHQRIPMVRDGLL